MAKHSGGDIRDVLDRAEEAEDIDKLWAFTAAINLVNATLQRIGGRSHWDIEDTRTLRRILKEVDKIGPLRTNYSGTEARVPNDTMDKLAAELDRD